jgi:hypothetical protein
MKYLLFVYGNYDEHPFVIKNIAKLLSEVSSTDVKYQFGGSGAIYHFTTVMKGSEVKKKISEPLQQLTAMYFMVPFNKNVNFYFDDKKIENHLFQTTDTPDNLSEIEPLEYKLSELDGDLASLTNDLFIQNLSDFIGVDLNRLVEGIENLKEKPTLNEILDKINECGFESLTETEKIILDEYSKG